MPEMKPTISQPRTSTRQLKPFDQDMLRVMRYHKRLVKLCQQLAAIQVDGYLFERLTKKEFQSVLDNQIIRRIIEDRIRALLKRNNDWPPTTEGRR